ncbi:uncharacterized protein EV422DRAFT_565537 [Fimicolochytrium jonesii]|uniref:uncharacterized protein n=1 Tax=Fimicolochytrium jonesii TaxID=1396493 RepID=UPI0022FED1DC|nr:uncharacterized protein EV422DRAFT_565537 [Fimicolochytrium jonesii]KAI8823602.1 hypothetical protein EV422DRAFT_565537 [Fimicolochytrium jonesii]
MTETLCFIANKNLPIPDEIGSFKQLEELLISCPQAQNARSKPTKFPALKAAIDSYETYATTSGFPEFNFSSDLLPFIIQCARREQDGHRGFHILKAGYSDSVSYSAATAVGMLANAFFLNLVSAGRDSVVASRAPDVGSVDLVGLYSKENGPSALIATQRLVCLVSYFHQCSATQQSVLASREIIVERLVTKATQSGGIFDDLALRNKLVKKDACRIYTGSMEESSAGAFVDFANRRLHIHSIIPSCTQEEVLFTVCPEAYLAILFCETMADNEAITLRNVKRWCAFSGYGNTFRFTGPYVPPQGSADAITVLAIDAVSRDHLGQTSVQRDVRKAYLAFSSVPAGTKIVTGHWGCGCFGGNKTHKFLQQVCAATMADRFLDYCVYEDAYLESRFIEILNKVEEKNMTIADVYTKLLLVKSKIDYEAFVGRALGLEGAKRSCILV